MKTNKWKYHIDILNQRFPTYFSCRPRAIFVCSSLTLNTEIIQIYQHVFDNSYFTFFIAEIDPSQIKVDPWGSISPLWKLLL